jgi:hypothetical protein
MTRIVFLQCGTKPHLCSLSRHIMLSLTLPLYLSRFEDLDREPESLLETRLHPSLAKEQAKRWNALPLREEIQ